MAKASPKKVVMPVRRATKRVARAGPKKQAAAGYIEPMKALGTTTLPTGDGWLLEIKFDGFRVLGVLNGGAVELWSRNKNVLTERYPEVTAGLKKLRCIDAILDGEIVALDEEGRSRFQLMQHLEEGDGRPPLRYYVFDLLHLNGRSLLSEPVEERKRLLAKLLAGNRAEELQLSPLFELSAKDLLAQVAAQGLEGIIGKARGSVYEPGRRSGRWIKYRLARDQEFVIGGYTAPAGSRSYFGAILVGYYENGRLLYAGKVGTGFNRKLLGSLFAKFKKVESAECRFVNLPMPRKPRFGNGMTRAAMKDVTWLEPALVAQIKFSEWTREGSLRHPVFLGLREDKLAKDVRREAVVE